MFRVWREHDWKGSAKTRLLVLALRDYFAERVEQSGLPDQITDKRLSQIASSRPPGSPLNPADENEDDADQDTATNVPLPDSWVIEYLQQTKRLRYVQRTLPSYYHLTGVNDLYQRVSTGTARDTQPF
jgi:hypothetical protein